MSVRVRTRVKICGITTRDELALAVDAGADAVGFIRAASPRQVERDALETLARATPAFVTAVAVVADDAPSDVAHAHALGLTLQFSGTESEADCELASPGRPYLKAFHVPTDDRVPGSGGPPAGAFERATWLFDSAVDRRRGGTGIAFDWTRLTQVARRRPIVVSGGLTPENVARCVRTLRPYAVDVRSGVETDGRKDATKMRAFVHAVREADGQA